jgi:hypothetical protein
MRARGIRWALLVCVLALVACDSGPSGPGVLLVRVSGPGLGGALIGVEGTGIQSFAGTGSTQAYGAPVGGSGAAHRVLIIDPVGGELAFEILVEDLGMEPPILTVLTATGTDNSIQPAAGVVVLVEG